MSTSTTADRRRRRVGGISLAVVALVVGSCTRGRDPSPGPPATRSTATTGTAPAGGACRPTEPVPPTNQLQAISYEGKERHYVLSVPPGYDGMRPAPIIFDFYGRDGDAEEQVADYELDDVATAAGMLVVTPQADPDRDGSKNSWATDIPLVTDILTSVAQRWCIDPDAVYAAGFSDGGVFSAYLACELPDTFAAVGTVAEIDYPPHCEDDDRGFSVIGFHGKSDQLVPFDGGSTDDLDGRSGLPGSPDELPPSAPIEQTFGAFASLDGCATEPTRADATADAEHLVYPRCRPGLAVELYVIDDGGHEWPGDPGASAAAAGTVDANRRMVDFFLAHPRR